MKKKIKSKVKYTDDLGDAAEFEGARILTRDEERALGLPMPGEAKNMRIVRKVHKDARINVRLAKEALEGLKKQAAKVGMPYQTLAASVLHMVARGDIQLAFLQKHTGTKHRVRA